MSSKVSTRLGEIESRWTMVGGLRMHARVSVNRPSAGTDVPVVLVHGLLVSSLYMLPTAQRLAPFYRVFAPDMPGFGKSDKPSRALNVRGMAVALGEWMDAIGLGRAVLVGNSLGCQIIADVAARSPHRVEGVVLTGPTVDCAGRTVREQSKRLLIDMTRERFSLALIQLRSLCEAGLKRSWQTAQFALEDRIEEHLPHLHAPVLVIRGSNDQITPQVWAEQVAGLLPRGRLAVIQGAPHALNYSTPDELVSLIREFVEREVPAARIPKNVPER
ncbi:MAG TPA: alpha/beta hydrolase [Pyrinomonadaceae bacterium]|nr:alpha/beta hydrolase [Pyrinomonadaceae bacterium]